MDNAGYTSDLRPGPVMLDAVMMHLARSPEVFAAASGVLTPDHYSRDGETAYRYIWAGILEHFERYGTLPSYQTLSTVVLSRVQADAGVSVETIRDTESLLDWMWGEKNPPEAIEPEPAIEWLQLVLEDRVGTQPIMDAMEQQRIGGQPDFAAAILEAADNMQSIRVTGMDLDDFCVPRTWLEDEETPPLVPTGIPLLDERLGGGTKGGDVNVLLGTTGVGKTMLATQLLVEGARYQAKQGAVGRGKMSYLFSYEGPKRDSEIRMMCYAAQIHRSRLENMRNFNELSRRGNLQEYEKARWRRELDEGVDVLGEWERWQASQSWLDGHLRLVDMGPDSGGSRGHGGISEIKSMLDMMQLKRPQGVQNLVMDWGGTIVDQHLRASNKDVSRHYYLELKSFVNQVRRQIAVPYNCTVWVLHQLTGAANKKSPSARLHHSEAEGCSLFAVNAWFAFCLGVKDHATNTCMLQATKTRRGEGMDAVICNVDGAFGCLTDASKNYRPDPHRGIVPISEARQYADFTALQRTQGQQMNVSMEDER